MDLIAASQEANNIMCEVLYKDSAGSWLKLTHFDQFSEFGGYSIGYFMRPLSRGGTGFVIKVLTSHPTYSALILTAAHCFIGNFNYNPGAQGFVVEDEIYDAIPLKASLD